MVLFPKLGRSVIKMNPNKNKNKIIVLMDQHVQISFVYSPTNKMSDENISQKARAGDTTNHAELICRRLQQNLKKIDTMQTLSFNKKLPSFKELKNNLLKINNKPAISSTSIDTNISNNISINHYGQIHRYGKQSTGMSQKMQTLNSFLTEIGEFKKSISQIRQRIIAPKSKDNERSFITSHKPRGTPAKNYDKYSYTSYKDLSSNKTQGELSYDRWKSHQKLHSLRPRPFHIQQFSIDASEPYLSPTK